MLLDNTSSAGMSVVCSPIGRALVLSSCGVYSTGSDARKTVLSSFLLWQSTDSRVHPSCGKISDKACTAVYSRPRGLPSELRRFATLRGGEVIFAQTLKTLHSSFHFLRSATVGTLARPCKSVRSAWQVHLVRNRLKILECLPERKRQSAKSWHLRCLKTRKVLSLLVRTVDGFISSAKRTCPAVHFLLQVCCADCRK